MKRILTVLYAVLTVAIFSFTVSYVTGFNPFAVGAAVTGLSFVNPGVKGALFVGINKEIWLPEIKEGFFPDDSFLKEARDMSAFVENDKINLAEAGVTPNVLINNTTYPIAVSQRTDVPIALELETFDTENTLIRNIEKAELSYDKRQSVIFGHKQALRLEFSKKAAHAYAPASDGTLTPVLPTTGTAGSMTFDDILDLYKRFNEVDIPAQGRVLVLHPTHEAELRKQDYKLFKEMLTTGDLWGFKIYRFSQTPIFDKTTGAKKAFGAAPGANDTISSIAFQKDEVMKAIGTVDMFAKEKDPLERGDIIGFQMRALALPIRNKAIGAIYSA